MFLTHVCSFERIEQDVAHSACRGIACSALNLLEGYYMCQSWWGSGFVEALGMEGVHLHWGFPRCPLWTQMKIQALLLNKAGKMYKADVDISGETWPVSCETPLTYCIHAGERDHSISRGALRQHKIVRTEDIEQPAFPISFTSLPKATVG